MHGGGTGGWVVLHEGPFMTGASVEETHVRMHRTRNAWSPDVQNVVFFVDAQDLQRVIKRRC